MGTPPRDVSSPAALLPLLPRPPAALLPSPAGMGTPPRDVSSPAALLPLLPPPPLLPCCPHLRGWARRRGTCPWSPLEGGARREGRGAAPPSWPRGSTGGREARRAPRYPLASPAAPPPPPSPARLGGGRAGGQQIRSSRPSCRCLRRASRAVRGRLRGGDLAAALRRLGGNQALTRRLRDGCAAVTRRSRAACCEQVEQNGKEGILRRRRGLFGLLGLRGLRPAARRCTAGAERVEEVLAPSPSPSLGVRRRAGLPAPCSLQPAPCSLGVRRRAGRARRRRAMQLPRSLLPAPCRRVRCRRVARPPCGRARCHRAAAVVSAARATAARAGRAYVDGHPPCVPSVALAPATTFPPRLSRLGHRPSLHSPTHSLSHPPLVLGSAASGNAARAAG